MPEMSELLKIDSFFDETLQVGIYFFHVHNNSTRATPLGFILVLLLLILSMNMYEWHEF